MPQLDPSTWMPAFVFSWTAFYIPIPQKIQGHVFLNSPAHFVVEDTKKDEWTWTWQQTSSTNL